LSLEKRCKQQWKRLGITNTKKLQQHIKELFADNTNQSEVLIGLYKLVLPNWDEIKKLNGFPVCGQELWLYICDQFITFDQANHPGCMAGGAWINQGFSSDRRLKPWEINFDNCEVVFNDNYNKVKKAA
jgi:hypothetical protein